MKAAAFSYARATSIADALQLLARHGDDAKVLSGGQSLMPALNLRLSRPAILVDIGRLSELRGITVAGGTMTIGSLTRHIDLLGSGAVAEHLPLLREATAHVAHPAIRNRGTIGGNLAHADPASELPACMLALDATLVIRGVEHERRVAAEEFFQGIYATALAADELLTAVEIPLPASGARHFFREYARRSGDYAMVGLAAMARADEGRLSDLRLGYFAVGDRPQLVRAAARLVGAEVTPALLAAAKAELMTELDPASDQQATAAMRRHLAGLLLESCVATVLDRSDLTPGPAL
jgi:aerobic carbon-monoxide dehydrogenase medium subunit